MLVRSTLAEGHSHVWNLPPRKPEERAVFWSEYNEELTPGHSHALFYGGDRGPGNLESEVHGSSTTYVFRDGGESSEARKGDVNPDQPDPDRPHTHVVPVLL